MVGMGYARFLEDVVQAVSPEVPWESEIARRTTIIGTGQGGNGVLWEAPFKGSNVVVGRGDALAEDGEEDEDWGACETKNQSTERDGVHEPTPPSPQVR